MDMKHGTCGDEENRVIVRDKSYLDPVIEVSVEHFQSGSSSVSS